MATMQTALGTPVIARGRSVLAEVFRALASIRLAAAVGAGLALLSLAGILVPQLPESARANPGATAEWLDRQRRSLGPVADWLYRLGFYDVFHSAWIVAGFAVLALSVVACTARRVAPTWRNVAHPVKAVPDAFLDGSRPGVVCGAAVAPGVLEQALRRRHFHVESWKVNESVWVFADRYPWAQLATFASHAALVLLIIGALVTHFGGFTSRLFIAEGADQPVFPLNRRPAMNVELVKATARFDPEGRPFDFRSQLLVTENGNEVKTCTVTASQPCYYSGYRIRQAFYFPYGADIRVRDLTDGRVVYRESLALTDFRTAPRLIVSDPNGDVVLDRTLALEGSVAGVDGTVLTVPGLSAPLWVGLAPVPSNAPDLVLFQLGETPGGLRLSMPLHAPAAADGLRFEFAGLETTPSANVNDLPTTQAAGTAPSPVVQLTGANTGQSPGGGSATLLLSGLGSNSPILLGEGDSSVVGNLEYTFVRSKPFVGIEVRKDRGETFIWIGSALLVIGLGVTLWVPRRRLWARLDSDGFRIAGLAPRLANLRRELEFLAGELETLDSLASSDSR
jgi:cytochrome c biogenesis protein ResB